MTIVELQRYIGAEPDGIWGMKSAANAICMVSRNSGTFVGGVTHGAGFVQANGSSGYFDSQISLLGVGGSNASASIWSIIPLIRAENHR